MNNILSQLIFPLRAFQDNYIWVIKDDRTKTIWVVDPGDASPIIHYLTSSGYTLGGILITHHHYDHTDGIHNLIAYAGGLPVVGSSRSPLAAINFPVNENSEIELSSFTFKVMEIPGHTLDHVAFYVNSQFIFCGDTLFSAGCGRVFEGTPHMMYNSLEKILSLDETTSIYCGHEYTLANLDFAKHVEPLNKNISKKITLTHALLNATECSLPSQLYEEKQFNPFLRCIHPNVVAAVEKHSGKQLKNPVEVFRHLREWKNTYR